MKDTLKFVCLLVLLSLASALHTNHLLHKFDEPIKHFRLVYSAGATSKAFSIAMKMYMETRTFYEETGFTFPTFDLNSAERGDCSALLKQLHEILLHSNWVEMYQKALGLMAKLQSVCTNMDFEHGGLSALQGFDDKCALCTVITRVMENYIVYHRRDVAEFVENQFCSLFDGVVKPTCEAFTHYVGPTFIRRLLNKEDSDVICHSIGWCTNPQCKIKPDFHIPLNEVAAQGKPAPWEWIVHLFTDHFGDKHLPPFDLDNDTFSDISTFRGYHWRGVDCNEVDSNVYPGRKTASAKIIGDHDCNGIFGKSPKGKSYEELFCKDTKRYGVVVIGDSAGAHFSIPEKFFNVSMMHKGSFKDLLPRIADELDIPHESGYTGHAKTEYLSHSVYKYLRNWNLCNNNDYQNLGVNGGDSGNTWGNIKALKRDPQNDHPLLMFMELIGNDVCAKDFNGMTKPEEFKRNILKLLNWLDTTTPAGSHLIIVGLADGDLLYDYLHDSVHPLNTTYEVVYDFLNCLKISPCWGWLNSNETIRKYTTQRAKNLSKMYEQIIKDGTKFKNFDVIYYQFPTFQIINRKEQEGGDPRDMIERCDGFHPSGEFHSDLADWFWNKIQTEHPDWIGPQNPHNEQIRQIFGIQDLK